MRSVSITFWAWTASIVVHIIILAIFVTLRLPHPPGQLKTPIIPVARISRVKQLIHASPVISKPKIKRIARNRFAKRPNKKLAVNRIFDSTKPSAKDFEPFAPKQNSPAGRTISPKGTEFFGSWTDERKICYLVDCSGSMQGLFSRVRKQLTESISSLQPDRYFSIIFFGRGQLIEFENGQLIRATAKSKLAAFEFINSIRPAGRTNALEAMKRSLQIRDSNSGRASIIYFLTDGFELTEVGTKKTSQKIADLLNRFAPGTKINTIGFWPETNDRKTLEIIARQSGGECVIIADNYIL